MFITKDENKIIDDFKLTDKIEITNISRHDNDPQSVECRAVVILRGIDIGIEYTQFIKRPGSDPFGRLNGKRWKRKDGKPAFTQAIQVVDPSTGKVTPASFGITYSLEKTIAKAIDEYFTDEDSKNDNPIHDAITASEGETVENKDPIKEEEKAC